MLVKGLYLEG